MDEIIWPEREGHATTCSYFNYMARGMEYKAIKMCDCGASDSNDMLDACKSAYEKHEQSQLKAKAEYMLKVNDMIDEMRKEADEEHRPGKGLDEAAENEKLIRIKYQDIVYQICQIFDTPKEKCGTWEVVKKCKERFHAPSLPTVEQMLSIYNSGCKDGVPTRAIFNKIHALLTNPAGGK